MCRLEPLPTFFRRAPEFAILWRCTDAISEIVEWRGVSAGGGRVGERSGERAVQEMSGSRVPCSSPMFTKCWYKSGKSSGKYISSRPFYLGGKSANCHSPKHKLALCVGPNMVEKIIIIKKRGDRFTAAVNNMAGLWFLWWGRRGCGIGKVTICHGESGGDG